MNRLLAAAAACLSSFAGACASIPQQYDIVDDIAENQSALNDAYGRAVNGQILLNALRSRDRWPRHYTSVNGISDDPTTQTTAGLSLSPLGLGSAASPFAGSSVSVGRELSTHPSYGLTPMDTEAMNRAVLSPTRRPVFQHYWDGGWPRDLLLFVMAASISRAESAPPAPTARGRAAQVAAEAAGARNWSVPLRNTATQLDGHCMPSPQAANAPSWDPDPANDCAFFQLVHRLADFSSGDGRARIRLASAPDPDCERSEPIQVNSRQAELLASLASLSEVTGNELTVRLRDPDPPTTATLRRRGQQPPARMEVELANCDDDAAPVLIEVLPPAPAVRPPPGTPAQQPLATYFLELRSLDAMVYAMGEVLRAGQTTDNRVLNGAVPLVRGPCANQPCPLTPLFRVVPGPVQRDEDFAAVVVHRGRHYFAGPAVDVFPVPQRMAEGGYDERALNRMAGDRTATVLTLLTQLFALNSSPGTLAPPPSRPVVID